MAIVQTSVDTLTSISQSSETQYILKGLSKKRIGFIVSGPDVGKGFLCLSIAYELATDLPLLNLKGGKGTFKTLYWPIEDGVEEIAKRMLCHMAFFPDFVKEQISSNVSLWDSSTPLCQLRNGSEVPGSEAARNELISACQDYDLLIIDTIREAAGNADEIEDDNLIKSIIQEIAVKGDVAVLLVHHLTKAVIRGTEKISNVSGSGFSRTQANSRMHLYLEKIEPKQSNEPLLKLSHIKANYIPKTERLYQSPLKWTAASLLCAQSFYENFNHFYVPVSPIIPAEIDKALDLTSVLATKREIIEEEPKEINIGLQPISSFSSQKRAQQAKEDQLVSDEDRALLKAYNERKRRDQK
jgi:RecA-family ATPase